MLERLTLTLSIEASIAASYIVKQGNDQQAVLQKQLESTHNVVVAVRDFLITQRADAQTERT
jgi:hypothetical protein